MFLLLLLLHSTSILKFTVEEKTVGSLLVLCNHSINLYHHAPFKKENLNPTPFGKGGSFIMIAVMMLFFKGSTERKLR